MRGRILTEEDIQRIVDFYNSDEYSRQLTGMKSVKQGNKRVNVQKRLLLPNFNQLYAEYKKQSSVLAYKTFGFSLFVYLSTSSAVTDGRAESVLLLDLIF